VYLTADEIAREALHQFDVGRRPLSMRQLAAALGVGAPALYHYFPTESHVIRAALQLVFEEAIVEALEIVGDPLAGPVDPEVLLTGVALAVYRAFDRHYRIAPHMAMAPEATSRLAGVLTILGSAMEQLGASGPSAAASLSAYGNYVYGSVVIGATRRIDDERFQHAAGEPFSTTSVRPADAPPIGEDTAEAVDRLLARGVEEEAFLTGLRVVIAGIRAAP